MLWKEIGDKLPPLLCEIHQDCTAICRISPPRRHLASDEVVDHHGDIATALEQLPTERTLVLWAQVEQCLHHTKLAQSEAVFREMPVEADRDRLGCSGHLDKCVQSQSLPICSFKVCTHGCICLITPLKSVRKQRVTARQPPIFRRHFSESRISVFRPVSGTLHRIRRPVHAPCR